jgi:tRNA 5-methylaminomethyl-2-thiouridine biosynthesis bifunctional protein
MPPDHAAPPLLDWHDGQPYSTRFGDVYFSRASGLDETRHVFLQHNRLAQRWASLPAHGQFVLGETGFGTGLNFLCAWQCWDAHAPATARLRVVSTEKYPLDPQDLARALALWPALAPYAAALLQGYRALGSGPQHMLFAGGRVSLTLLIGDVLETLPHADLQADAWFLDGFAPAKNPEMWCPALFATLARLSRPQATFATFTSAGVVKRGMQAAGFVVEKVAGFGRKRDMLRGYLAHAPAPAYVPPWLQLPPPPVQRHAVVVGAGLAGASVAYSLACRGWQVTVLERHAAPAAEASGNAQGMLYAKLSPHVPPLTQVVLAGYGYTLRLLHQLLPADGVAWHDCGVLQLPADAAEAQRQAQLAALDWSPRLCQWLDTAAASAVAGVGTPTGGLYFPAAGWVHPPALVAAMLAHPGITVHTHTDVLTLQRAHEHWTLYAGSQQVAAAPVVVLATAHASLRFAQAAHVPLKPIRGQITAAPATPASAGLRTVLCGERYLAPARLGEHTLGATFDLHDQDTRLQAHSHADNLAALVALAPAAHAALDASRLDPHTLAGRAALRATTPDYLPVIGPLADATALATAYASLRHDATLPQTQPCPWWPGLYLTAGHGSRGLITAPLAGEVLAAMLNHEPLPLLRPLLAHLHPQRFALRALMRANRQAG